jgi:hypothetical protein
MNTARSFIGVGYLSLAVLPVQFCVRSRRQNDVHKTHGPHHRHTTGDLERWTPQRRQNQKRQYKNYSNIPEER